VRLPAIPAKGLVAATALGAIAALAALLLGFSVHVVGTFALGYLSLLIVFAVVDVMVSRLAWREAAPRMTRLLPSAFAIGVTRELHLLIDNEGPHDWRVRIHDHVDGSFVVKGLPAGITVPASKRAETVYTVTPSRRGEVVFEPAELRVRSRFWTCELLERLGERQVRRVYPDFAQVARYAWLAGDRRLQEIGIKTFQQRGEGTDFKQLSEYRYGDPVRHLDWKATLRVNKPIIREFQDERDQYVLLLVDCGRRMRADDREGRIGTAHFDQVLNAVMLLSYVALKQGDAVGALTFGTPPQEARSFSPRKGAHALNALMGELYAVQPTPTHSDYVAAAQDLLRRHAKRALVIVITNFRDEDSNELSHALRLLRSRHLVLLASLRERIVRELITQPLSSGEAAVEIASAHLYEQSRRDAFNRLAARDALMVDAEPERLGIELVNRYNSVKRAGLI
jgi:uncharacterized protein (DUF58 family)